MTPTNIFEEAISSDTAKNSERAATSDYVNEANAGDSPALALARIEFLLSWARREFASNIDPRNN